MSSKPIIDVKCPCCGHILEVSVERERVLSYRKGVHLKDDRRDGEDEMDVAMRNKRESDQRIKDEFSAAQENLRTQSERMDQAFREAQKKAEKDKTNPRDPFGGGKIWD
ncbi:MAG: hypothetical protein EXS14_07385 [Planctomycetes bacterium]|nr:hypothetical protein [Planctomycetota bacterium]